MENIPSSVCVGTYRLVVNMNEEYIHFTPVFFLTMDEAETAYSFYFRRMSAFVFKTIVSSRIPRSLRHSFVSAAERTLSNVLGRESIEIVKWVIGNSLIDPVPAQKILFFYGLGGDGKTVSINTILANLPGCSSALTRDYVGSSSNKLSEDDIHTLLNNRVVTFGDCILEEGYKINSQFLKRITSGDAISTSTVSGKIECTGIFASNSLWHPSKSVMQPWFARRMVLINFNKLPDNLMLPPAQYNDVDVVHFAVSCIKTRTLLAEPPITLDIALRTIFGSKAQRFTRGVKYCLGSSHMDCTIASHILSSHCHVDVEPLTELVKKVNPNLVAYHRWGEYIRDICSIQPRF
jgi:hypothetical protein